MKYFDLPEELKAGLCHLEGILPKEDIPVRFAAADCLRLHREKDAVVIGYSRKNEAFRGLSMAKRVWETGKAVTQHAKFDTLTLMADCSRNAVLKPAAVKQLMNELAILGFNGLMLYTEDTYELEGHPYFGHLRGRYSAAELKELDAYGKDLGIELIPCIQTLAHLNAIFNWKAYAGVRDVTDILLADHAPTYAFIEDMLRTCRQNFTTRRINIGMDEAHLLGRGAYLDKNGYSPKPDIMLRHLARVVELCKKYGFEPVMWSDMFFRMEFDGRYNVPSGELSQEVLDKIPEDVALCYWNYYTPPAQEPMLEHMFRQHSRTGNELWFAGGSWSWYGVTPKNYFSNRVTPLQLKYAAKYGVKNVIATAWGDDGAECSMFAVLPSLLQYAELCYGEAEDGVLDTRCQECFGISYGDFMKLDQVGKPRDIDPNWSAPPCMEKMALYNDCLLGILDADVTAANTAAQYAEDAAILRTVPHNRYRVLFDTQLAYAELLSFKTDLSARIKAAYRSGDRAALAAIAEEDIPQTEALLDAFHAAMGRQWFAFNRPFGFEVQDIRQGGLKQRLRTAQMRISQYLAGETDRLEELEQPDLPVDADRKTLTLNRWARSTTASVMAW